MPRQPLERYDELMTPAEVAGALRVDPVTVTRWANAGQLTAIRTPGGQRRYKRAEVDVILNPEPGPVTATDPTRVQMMTDPQTRRMSGVAIHGCIPFDVPFVTEIAPNLWQGGCEDGLVLPKQIRHLVSLYPWESYDVRHELASSVSVRMLDGLGQDMGLIPELARWVNACRASGPVLVHCQAGLNRSSLIVASALILAGRTAAEAIALIAEIHLGEARTWHLKVAGNGHDRMATLLDRIWLAVSGADVVAVEGPSYGSGTNGRQSGHHERAGLWWLVTHTLLRRQAIPWASVPPASLKRFATGKGNAPKDAMLIAAVRRFPNVDVSDNNEADALFLAAAAADWFGCPLVTMPQAQRAGLEAVEWPQLAARAGAGSAR